MCLRLWVLLFFAGFFTTKHTTFRQGHTGGSQKKEKQVPGSISTQQRAPRRGQELPVGCQSVFEPTRGVIIIIIILLTQSQVVIIGTAVYGTVAVL